MEASDQGLVRIGELSRRVGLSADRLRAWERRYDLLRPSRSAGGFRLYSEADERRVRTMQEHLGRGLSAAEAARLAAAAPVDGDIAPPGQPGAPHLDEVRQELRRGLEAFTDGRVQVLLDRLFGSFSLETALREIIYPYLHELGESWARGEVSVAQEHFASRLIEARLLALARGWDQGVGPRVILACPAGEEHNLGAIGFGLALRNRGWQVTYLGSNTPAGTILDAAGALAPKLIALSAVTARRFTAIREELRELAQAAPLAIAGAGASERLAELVGAELLPGDPVSEAERVSTRHSPARA